MRNAGGRTQEAEEVSASTRLNTTEALEEATKIAGVKRERKFLKLYVDFSTLQTIWTAPPSLDWLSSRDVLTVKNQMKLIRKRKAYGTFG